MDKMLKRVRLLEAYAVVSLLFFCVVGVAAFTQGKQKFDELTVERLNVVEKNGQLRAVIANTDRMPDPIIEGKSFKSERVPGMIFYNGLGDECGGLIFGAVKGGDKYGAYGGFTFDQYRQSQSIGLVYNDHNGSRQVGLSVWDRPEKSLIDLMQQKDAVEKLTDGAEKEAAKQKLREAELAPTRVFVGRTKERESKVTLYDDHGNARINLVVDANGTPRLDFLDARGSVTYSLPGSNKPAAVNGR
ncbi:MAG TPA: hypothetical protein VLL54_02085 [Pyrinomonadaceae bacterium]|nr:hypothetical protein [Pyrinomonadaceae bacterium]